MHIIINKIWYTVFFIITKFSLKHYSFSWKLLGNLLTQIILYRRIFIAKVNHLYIQNIYSSNFCNSKVNK